MNNDQLDTIMRLVREIGGISAPLAADDDTWNEVDSRISIIETLLEELDIIDLNHQGKEAL
jgi:hypothetical protein